MLRVIRDSKTLTQNNMRMMIFAPKCSGPKEDEGYKYIPEIDMSVQGQNANNAWRTTYNLLKLIKVPIEVEFVWQDNPKAYAAGVRGKVRHCVRLTKTKTGTVIEVVPANARPEEVHHNFRRCGTRDHKSYIVGVIGVRYWLLVKNLNLKA